MGSIYISLFTFSLATHCAFTRSHSNSLLANKNKQKKYTNQIHSCEMLRAPVSCTLMLGSVEASEWLKSQVTAAFISTDEICHLSSQNTNKLMSDTNLALVITTHSWRQQFIEAVTVNTGQSLMCFLSST